MCPRSCALARGVQTFPVAPANPEVQICLPPHSQDARWRQSQQTRLTWHCSCGEPLRSRQPLVLITALCGGVLHAAGTRPTVPRPWAVCSPSAQGWLLCHGFVLPVCVRHQWGRRWTAVPESTLWGGACRASGRSSCAWLMAGCCCLLDSGCRLVAHTGLAAPLFGPAQACP